MVYSATGKYIHPTWLRQIVETDSSTRLGAEQQAFVSEDQKHTSHVARVEYKKLCSQDFVAKAKEALATIGKTPMLSLSHIGNFVSVHNSMTINMKTDKEDAT